MQRLIIKIDEELCNGCGACVTGCAEGALQIVDGKARLVREQYCDGLGACIGECPTGALILEERVADPFDVEETNKWLMSLGRETVGHVPTTISQTSAPAAAGGCPGSRVLAFNRSGTTPQAGGQGPLQPVESELGQWPVQLKLVPVSAPYLRGADLLVAADCVPFAYADFHRKLLKGRAVVIACPKLDHAADYVDKLANIIRQNDLRSITVAHMEVPCCFGLGQIVKAAIEKAGVRVPVMDVNIAVTGEMK
ncbi:MAG TPA: 4Fe-4S binding protein [Bacillota bacterium]|nr:4Fe-4S binding protein [Bacillota bacterium]